MSQSKASPIRVSAAERAVQALELRRKGLTYAQIGTAMRVSESRAYAIVKRELARLNAKRGEEAEEVRRIELLRLDHYLERLSKAIERGDVAAITAARRIIERRCKMLGIDAPERRELSGPGGGPIPVSEDVSQAAMELIRERERERMRNGGRGDGG